MKQTISIVIPPQEILKRVSTNNYFLRKKLENSEAEATEADKRYRYNYRICPSTRSVPYIGYTYSKDLRRIKEEISRRYLQ